MTPRSTRRSSSAVRLVPHSGEHSRGGTPVRRLRPHGCGRGLPQTGEVALHARPIRDAGRGPAAERRRGRCWSRALAEPGDPRHAHRRPQGGGPGHAGRRQGPAQERHPRPQPSALLRTQGSLPCQGTGSRRAGLPDPSRPRARSSSGPGDDRGGNRADGRSSSGGGRAARRGGIDLEVVDPRTLVPLDIDTSSPRWRRPTGS